MNAIRTFSTHILLIVATMTAVGEESVQILRVGLWHGDEVSVEAGPDWWGIFPEGDSFTLQSAPVTITREFDVVVDEKGQATGKLVKVPQEAEPVLLVRGIPGLKDGRLSTTTTRLPESFVEPDQSIELQLIGEESHTSARLEVGGRMITPTGQFDRLPEDIEFTLVQTSGTDLVKQSLAKFPGIVDGNPRIVWAGDIDRDKKVDVLLDIEDKYFVTHLALYLSSAAKEGELVGKVANGGRRVVERLTCITLPTSNLPLNTRPFPRLLLFWLC